MSEEKEQVKVSPEEVEKAWQEIQDAMKHAPAHQDMVASRIQTLCFMYNTIFYSFYGPRPDKIEETMSEASDVYMDTLNLLRRIIELMNKLLEEPRQWLPQALIDSKKS